MRPEPLAKHVTAKLRLAFAETRHSGGCEMAAQLNASPGYSWRSVPSALRALSKLD